MNEIKVNVTNVEGNVVHIKQEVVETKKIYAGNTRDYGMDSIQSIIDVVKDKGSTTNSIIFYNDNGIEVIFNDSVQDRELDTTAYSYKTARPWKDWQGICDNRLSQKDLANFLKRDEQQILGVNKDLLQMSVQKIQFSTETNGEYSEDANGNIVVMYKENNKDGVAKIPTEFAVKMPVLNESDLELEIEFELELVKPKSADDKPYFVIRCPKKDKYMDLARSHEIEKMKLQLEGYLVLAGKM